MCPWQNTEERVSGSGIRATEMEGEAEDRIRSLLFFHIESLEYHPLEYGTIGGWWSEGARIGAKIAGRSWVLRLS